MDYMSEYKRWLENPALSDEERAELQSVEGNQLSLIHISRA